MEKHGYIYILFNKQNGTLYTGVTSNLIKRIWEHKEGFVDGFTKRYKINKLGYFEVFNNMVDALANEKRIKCGSRKKKLMLIEAINPQWRDL